MGPTDDNESILYEVNLEADAAIAGPFDTWLRDHVADVLQHEGFLSAEILDDDTPAPEGRIRRITQYRLRNRAAYETYLRDHAPRMRAQGIEKFGDRYTATRRVLAHREEFVRGAFSTENCLNCGEVLRGQHCSHCGQRAKVRVLSLGTLVRDLLGDLTNFDSRLWRTLVPLAFRPGQLTVDFLRGRRTHYSPPFRMYLILSVVFFLLSTTTGSPGDAIKFDTSSDGGANLTIRPDGVGSAPEAAAPSAGKPAPAGKAGTEAATAATTAPAGTTAPPKLDPQRQKIVDAIVSRLPANEQAKARVELEREFGTMTPEQIAPVRKLVDDPCGNENLKVDIGPFKDKYEPRLREACRKITADGRGFGRAVYDNIPKMMFIFLPLIAALMFVLYLGSGRYYVEHLLFFVHFHAFFFLGGTVALLFGLLASWTEGTAVGKGLSAAEDITIFALVFYVPYYLYRAMRRVYGQGRFVTLVKYGLLGIGYLICATLTMIGLLAYTALTL